MILNPQNSMGDDHVKTLHAKSNQLELEELYQGIPDESVNLTFQDLANVNSSHNINTTTKVPSPSLSTLPSLDFKKGLEALNQSHHHHDNSFNHHHHHHQDFSHASVGAQSRVGEYSHHHHDNSFNHHHHHHQQFSHASGGAQSRVGEYSKSYDGMKSGESLASEKGGSGGRRRRPGIPHSKICTICSNYVYIFRTRCLVCGRVYCRQCVETGMGEMTEGRKCVECLGLRFSQRYIERAGIAGLCSWRYPSTLKNVELKWAEKGPRRNGDRGYGQHHSNSIVSSRPRTPTTPRSPLSIASTDQPSFVMSASYANHHLPL